MARNSVKYTCNIQIAEPSSRYSADIYYGDNLHILESFPPNMFDLIYIDPPFNTGKKRCHTKVKCVRDPNGDSVRFQGRRYKTIKGQSTEYDDQHTDYLGFIRSRLEEAFRILKSTGSILVHLDYRAVHLVRLELDRIFGANCFKNEIIWHYDWGGRARKKWPAKHDNILWYVKDPKNYTYHYDQIDYIPRLAPGLVDKEKAKLGKKLTDVWWGTVACGKERTEYATQKPLWLTDRIVRVHSNPDDLLLDFFSGSGTFGASANRLGRNVVLVDNNPDAIKTMADRLAFANPTINKGK